MKHLICLSLVVLSASMLHARAWERVYPTDEPTWDELPFHTINLDMGIALIGSRDGYVLQDNFSFTGGMFPPFSNGKAEVFKTPAHFDILAITYEPDANTLVFGGRRGNMARAAYADGSYPFPFPNFDSAQWSFSALPINSDIKSLFALNGRLFALAGEQVFQSMDTGDSWQAVQGLDSCAGIMPFKERLYALTITEVRDPSYANFLTLQSTSGDGTWQENWQIPSGRPVYAWGFPLAVFIERFDGMLQNDRNPEARLYVFAEAADAMGTVVRSMSVSTTDGEVWLDHNSSTSVRCPVIYGCTSPWNPLNLPDSQRFVPSTIDSYDAIGIPSNYRIGNAQRLDFYDYNEWEPFLQSTIKHRALGLDITQWDSLLFNDFSDGLQRIETDGADISVSPLELPEDMAEGTVLQLETAAGVTYLLQEFDLDGTGYYAIHASEDLETWEQLYFRDQELELVPYGNDMLRMTRTTMYLLSDDSKIVPRRPWGSKNFFTWHPFLKTLFHLAREDGQLVLKQLQPHGQFGEFARTEVESSASYFQKLACPDGENLFAFGGSAEIAIIAPDGTVRFEHPWKYFDGGRYYINNIRFINGWYYIIGHVLLRTRDFSTYEYVGLAEGTTTSKVRDIREQDGFIFLFAGDHIYARELERGYLGSIEHDRGWRESDWLGWFQVIDQPAGRIRHLLLGESTVQRVAENKYRLNTRALGEIRVRTDWMPWVEQAESGKWFWLDRAGWPPRAWDSETEEWVRL